MIDWINRGQSADPFKHRGVWLNASCRVRHHPVALCPKHRGSAPPRSVWACLPSVRRWSGPAHSPSVPRPVRGRSGKECRLRYGTVGGSGFRLERRWFYQLCIGCLRLSLINLPGSADAPVSRACTGFSLGMRINASVAGWLFAVFASARIRVAAAGFQARASRP